MLCHIKFSHAEFLTYMMTVHSLKIHSRTMFIFPQVHTTDDGRFLGQLLPTSYLGLRPDDKFTLGKVALTDAFLAITVTTDRSFLLVADLEFCKFAEKLELEGRSTVCEITPDSRYVFCNSGE